MALTPLSQNKPSDDYDADAWSRFYESNPDYRRSAGAEAADPAPDAGTSGGGGEGSKPGEGGGEGEAAGTPPDYSFIPEQFAPDGKPDPTAFRTAYDELAAFKAQTEEARGELPENADGYTFAIPEGLELPEGVEIQIDENDPDIPALKAFAHEHGLSQKALDGIAGLFAMREARAQAEAMKVAAEEKKALGESAQSRIDTISRTLGARLPAEQAEALMNGSYSANAVKALEKLLSGPGGRQSTPAATLDTSKMTPQQMIHAANLAAEERGQRRSTR